MAFLHMAGLAFRALTNQPCCVWLIWRIFVVTDALQFSLQGGNMVAMLKIDRVTLEP